MVDVNCYSLPRMIQKVVLFLVLLQFILLWQANRKQNYFQVLPSTVWVAIMLIPFSLLQKYFSFDTATKQGVAISLVAIVLQASDYLAIKLVSRNWAIQPSNYTLKIDYLFRVALILSILIPIIHYAIAKQIPLLHQISGKYSPERIADFRENYIKLLNVPFYLKIIPNLVFTIFGPYSLIILVARKKYIWAFTLFAWCAFYALSSSADLPIVILLATTLLGSFRFLATRIVKVVAVIISIVIGFTIFSGFALTQSIETSLRPCITQSQSISTPGDKWRSCAGTNVVWFNRVSDRVGYRVFLTPIEVSNLWYEYYQSESSEPRSLRSVFNRDLSKSPANVIGNWSFVNKFPGKYKTSNASYSSIDADAFSFGWQFFIIMLLGLFFMRLSAIWKFKHHSSEISILSGFIISQLSIFPFQSSIQAILLSQGLLLILVLYFVQIIILHFRQGNPQVSSDKRRGERLSSHLDKCLSKSRKRI